MLGEVGFENDLADTSDVVRLWNDRLPDFLWSNQPSDKVRRLLWAGCFREDSGHWVEKLIYFAFVRVV